MSNEAISWAKKQKTGSPTRKAVLVAISDYANEDGICFPSQKRIASDTDLSERAVRGALADLEEMGFIRRSVRLNKTNGGYTSDTIELIACKSQLDHPMPQVVVIPRQDMPVPPAPRSGAPRQDVPLPPAPAAAPPGTTFRGPPAPAAAYPLIEPSLEPSGEPKTESARDLASQVPSMFSQFWLLYPNKIGIADARAKFTAAILSEKVSFETLMAGLKAYVNKVDDRAWCNPATWIFQERWNDIPAQKPIQRPKPKGTGIGGMGPAV